MTWLALKILGYLGAAFLIGSVTGWMLTKIVRRDRLYKRLAEAAVEITELRRQLDARTVNSDAQSTPLHAQSTAEQRATAQALEQLRDQSGLDQQRLHEMEAVQHATDNLIAALHREIASLRQELVVANEAGHRNPALELTIKELEGRLVRKMAEIDRLRQALNSEERKVGELERERELQNKSLLVLHQQLEMERKPQRVAG
jgi:chromosome segregation ATPase